MLSLLSLAQDFLLFVHLMHASGLLGCWSHSHLSTGTLAYCFEMVLLAIHTACLTKHQALPLPVCCTAILTVVLFLTCSFGRAAACQLFQFSYSFVCDQSPLHLSLCLILFWALCTSTLWAQISTCSLSISLMFPQSISFYHNFLHNFLIVFTINKLFFELSIMSFVITSCCFYIESSHLLLCGFIFFSVKCIVL